MERATVRFPDVRWNHWKVDCLSSWLIEWCSRPSLDCRQVVPVLTPHSAFMRSLMGKQSHYIKQRDFFVPLCLIGASRFFRLFYYDFSSRGILEFWQSRMTFGIHRANEPLHNKVFMTGSSGDFLLVNSVGGMFGVIVTKTLSDSQKVTLEVVFRALRWVYRPVHVGPFLCCSDPAQLQKMDY